MLYTKFEKKKSSARKLHFPSKTKIQIQGPGRLKL